jgi:hypothetical protein
MSLNETKETKEVTNEKTICKFNYAPRTDEVDEKLLGLESFLKTLTDKKTKQPIVHGSVAEFIKYVKTCRDKLGARPYEDYLEAKKMACFSRHAAINLQKPNVYGYSQKLNNDPKCWCWTNGNYFNGDGKYYGFCRQHF